MKQRTADRQGEQSGAGHAGGAMLRRGDEVNIHAEGVGVVTKKEARKLLQKMRSEVTVREVAELGMIFIEPVPF